ncbi:hypothetical protein [Luteimicrobium sp. DT211]|uniref:hypothetical protein n=1 Tax=Luteimicrobium sp. DT211 TaxID=3393412 RepID=UPI003CEC8244
MTIAMHPSVGAGTQPGCADCGDALHDGDDARCRWCEDNRARHPEDYELVAVVVPEAVAS